MSSPEMIGIAVVEQEGRVLIGKRAPGAPLAGMWEFPGGKARSGETAEEAAVRECLEETGLAIRIRELYATVEHEYEHGHVRLHFFTAEPVDPGQPPIEPFRWVPIAELLRYDFPPANATVIERLTQAC